MLTSIVSFIALLGWIAAAVIYRAYRQAIIIAVTEPVADSAEVGDALLDVICESLDCDPHGWAEEAGELVQSKSGLRIKYQPNGTLLAQRGELTALIQGKRAERLTTAAQLRNSRVLAQAIAGPRSA